MIKFFRNLPAGQAGIRQKLLEQNKIGSYPKYAIGEILFEELLRIHEVDYDKRYIFKGIE